MLKHCFCPMPVYSSCLTSERSSTPFFSRCYVFEYSLLKIVCNLRTRCDLVLFEEKRKMHSNYLLVRNRLSVRVYTAFNSFLYCFDGKTNTTNVNIDGTNETKYPIR